MKLVQYPSEDEQRMLARTAADSCAAFSEKGTHLSCAVCYSREHDPLECLCHDGYFSVRDGRVLAGPRRGQCRGSCSNGGAKNFASTGVRTEEES